MIRATSKKDLMRLWRHKRELDARGKHLNVLYLSAANSKRHELKKAEVAYDLTSAGKDWCSEIPFSKNRGRADLIDLTEGVVHEVIDSESEESIEEKRKRYPFPVEVHIVS